jgi:hypothetical protein
MREDGSINTLWSLNLDVPSQRIGLLVLARLIANQNDAEKCTSPRTFDARRHVCMPEDRHLIGHIYICDATIAT